MFLFWSNFYAYYVVEQNFSSIQQAKDRCSYKVLLLPFFKVLDIDVNEIMDIEMNEIRLGFLFHMNPLLVGNVSHLIP